MHSHVLIYSDNFPDTDLELGFAGTAGSSLFCFCMFHHDRDLSELRRLKEAAMAEDDVCMVSLE